LRNQIVDRILERAEREKADSDFSYFFSLLLAAEALMKVAVAGTICLLGDDKDRHRYRLEHALLRADGIGEWAQALNDALAGPAAHCLPTSAYPLQAEFTRVCKAGEWQYEAVRRLADVLAHLKIDTEQVGVKSDLQRWFRMFPTLRNKSRAHGAITSAKASEVAQWLFTSISAIHSNLSVIQLPWANLRRNLSGKYRVTEIAGDCTAFAPLRTSDQFNYADGIHVYLDTPRRSWLVHTDIDLQDFLVANGGFSDKSAEFLSYATDNRVRLDCSSHLTPPGTLPASHTEGLREFEQLGNCLSNAPRSAADYVSRPDLERQIVEHLRDTKREVVTLKGPGGIGKTSVALRAIEAVSESDRFELVVWFSARDIDLELSGPKPVRTHLTTAREISEYFAALTVPERAADKSFDAIKYFETQLQNCDLGASLFVFDNFETSQGPADLAAWLDAHIRRPNKILITTRKQEFRGDHPIEVGGMTNEEARKLVDQTSAYLGVAELLTPTYVEQLIAQSWGHPYVMKILLGEIAKERRAGSVTRLVASRDEILTALFERTYSSLSPASQRVFLTLSSWDSAVPRLILVAVISNSTDEPVDWDAATDTLIRYSLVQMKQSDDDSHGFLEVPLAARLFGQKKLAVSPLKAHIDSDAHFLQQIGPSRLREAHLGLDRRIQSLLAALAKQQNSELALAKAKPALEMICRGFPRGWLFLAEVYTEANSIDLIVQAKEAYTRYLETDASSDVAVSAWRGLAYCCHLLGDPVGELHAFVRRCELPSVPFWDVSVTANRLNEFGSLHAGVLTSDERRSLAEKLLTVMDKRKSEAGSDDLSRMAWLAIHARRVDRAKEYVQQGLKIDPDNYHLLRMAQKKDFLES